MQRSLEPYRGLNTEAIRQSFKTLEQYWTSVRLGPHKGPLRFDPSAVEAVLPYSFVIEEVAPGLSRVRVCGVEVDKLFDQETRGMPINSLFTPPSRKQLNGILSEVYQGPSVVETEVSLGAARGRLILLPLASSYGEVIRAMCAIIFEDVRHGGVYRLGLDTPPYRMQPLAHVQAPFSVIKGDRKEGEVTAPRARAPLSLVVSNSL